MGFNMRHLCVALLLALFAHPRVATATGPAPHQGCYLVQGKAGHPPSWQCTPAPPAPCTKGGTGDCADGKSNGKAGRKWRHPRRRRHPKKNRERRQNKRNKKAAKKAKKAGKHGKPTPMPTVPPRVPGTPTTPPAPGTPTTPPYSVSFEAAYTIAESSKTYQGEFETNGNVVTTTLPCVNTEVQLSLSQDVNGQRFATVLATTTYAAECYDGVSQEIVRCRRLFNDDSLLSEMWSSTLDAKSGMFAFSTTLTGSACSATPGPIPSQFPDLYQDAAFSVDINFSCPNPRSCVCSSTERDDGFGSKFTENTCDSRTTQDASFTLAGETYIFSPNTLTTIS